MVSTQYWTSWRPQTMMSNHHQTASRITHYSIFYDCITRCRALYVIERMWCRYVSMRQVHRGGWRGPAVTSTCLAEADLSESIGSSLDTWEDVTVVGLSLLAKCNNVLVVGGIGCVETFLLRHGPAHSRCHYCHCHCHYCHCRFHFHFHFHRHYSTILLAAL